MRACAKIKKVGKKWCVFSEDGTKNLGCSSTLEGAKKRLRQVEFFKNKGSELMNYNEVFNNFAKAINSFDPEQLGQAPDSQPRKVDVESESLTVEDSLRSGTIAGQPSDALLDKKNHFPVITETQARSSMARVMQLDESPAWYSGTIAQLRQEVYAGIMELHPDIEGLRISVPAEQVMALSDGEQQAETSISDVKDPNEAGRVNRDEVPQVKRPNITSAQVLAESCKDDETRQAIAGKLMEVLDAREEHLKKSKELAARLLKGGLTGDEFDMLSTYVQEDIMHELLHKGAAAVQAEDRRRELLDKLNA
jgi:hypothetical protein